MYYFCICSDLLLGFFVTLGPCTTAFSDYNEFLCTPGYLLCPASAVAELLRASHIDPLTVDYQNPEVTESIAATIFKGCPIKECSIHRDKKILRALKSMIKRSWLYCHCGLISVLSTTGRSLTPAMIPQHSLAVRQFLQYCLLDIRYQEDRNSKRALVVPIPRRGKLIANNLPIPCELEREVNFLFEKLMALKGFCIEEF